MSRPFRRARLDRWLRRGGKDPSRLLGLTREDGDELLVEAKRRLDAGEIDGAATLFDLHLAAFGRNPDALLGAGACRQARGEFVGAMENYRAAEGLRPDDPYARANTLECSLLLDEPSGIRPARDLVADLAPSVTDPGLKARMERLVAIADERLKAPEDPGAPTYRVESGLASDEFADLLRRSTLAERRPMDEPGTIPGMVAHADVIVTARLGGLLIGVSRAITDWHFCTYLSDLAVDRDHQRGGIGRELIHRTHAAAGRKTTLILLAAPLARSYYPHIGMTAHDSCWIIPRTSS